VPMGDTALVRGIARAAKRMEPRIRIVGVVAERAPVYAEAWRRGEPRETASADTIADGLAVRRALAANVAAIRELVDEVREVGEEAMLDAMEWLESREGVIAEPSGAAATAALLQEDERRASPRRIVLLVTGANLSPETTALLNARRRRAPSPPP